ncbi:MAG: hypothetical protein Q7S11_00790 [bacterium]|nr:hypothetical protein [bacterium]
MLTRRQLLITLGKHFFVMITAIIVASIAISILSRNITSIGDSLIEKKRLSIILSKRGEYLSGLKRDFNVVGEADKRIIEASPPSDNILPFVAILENIADQTSVQQSFKFGIPSLTGEKQNGMEIATIDYSIRVNGNVHTLINYLQRFESLPYFSTISSITISGGGTRGWEETAQATIEAKIYTLSNQ